ncbi:hypothetical protein AgCh_017196 [Apium graveolens]
MCNAFLIEEASTFCSHYFKQHVKTKHRKVPRNDSSGGGENPEINISIFSHPGRSHGSMACKNKKKRSHGANFGEEDGLDSISKDEFDNTKATIEKASYDENVRMRRYRSLSKIIPAQPGRSIPAHSKKHVQGQSGHSLSVQDVQQIPSEQRIPTCSSGEKLPDQSTQHLPNQLIQITPNQSGQHVPSQSKQHSPTQSLKHASQSGQSRQSIPHQSHQLSVHSRQHTPEYESQSRQKIPVAQSEPREHNQHHHIRAHFMYRLLLLMIMLEPSHKCSTKIRLMMYQKIEPTGYNWKKEVFRTFCVAHTRWKNHNIIDNGIGKDVYSKWIDFWKSSKFQQKSEIQKGNHSSGVDGHHSTHTSGSASHRTVAARLKIKLKCDPTVIELFSAVHTRGVKKRMTLSNENGEDGENEEDEEEIVLIDKKSQQTYELFEKLREQQEKTGQPVDENALFLEAAGGDENHKMQQELKEMKDRVKAMENQLAMIMETTSSRYRPSPNSDIDSEDDDN